MPSIDPLLQMTREDALALLAVCDRSWTTLDVRKLLHSIAFWLSDPNIGLLEWHPDVLYRAGEGVIYLNKLYQVRSTPPPAGTLPTNATWWKPLDALPVVVVTDINNPGLQLSNLPWDYSKLVVAVELNNPTGLDESTVYMSSQYTPSTFSSPYVVPAQGGTGAWVAIAGKYVNEMFVKSLTAYAASITTDLTVGGLLTATNGVAVRCIAVKDSRLNAAHLVLPENSWIINAQVLIDNATAGAVPGIPSPVEFFYGGVSLGTVPSTDFLNSGAQWRQLTPNGSVGTYAAPVGPSVGQRTIGTNGGGVSLTNGDFHLLVWFYTQI